MCFHAQQAVEKSLKAVLALYEIEYPRRHDLGELLELVKPLAPVVAQYTERIISLAPYAVEVRYEVEFEPDDDQATAAVQTAEEVYELIKLVTEKK